MSKVTVLVCLTLITSGGAYGHTTPSHRKIQPRPSAAPAKTAPESAHQLMKDVIYNELRDWKDNSFWEYRTHLVTGSKNVLREQVETPKGPIYEVLARDGQPLEGTKAAREKQRLTSLLTDPSKLHEVEQKHASDEARLKKIMTMMPEAYVFRYIGKTTGNRVVLAFAPNPKYSPSGYVGRIMYGLSGRIVVNQRLKRLVAMDGRLAHKIDFGFGILGYVDQGGTFRIHRTQVSPKHWKTDLVDVNVHGRILLFSNVSKQEKETRWGFSAVPQDISLAQAGTDLKQAAKTYRENLASKAKSGAVGETAEVTEERQH